MELSTEYGDMLAFEYYRIRLFNMKYVEIGTVRLTENGKSTSGN